MKRKRYPPVLRVVALLLVAVLLSSGVSSLAKGSSPSGPSSGAYPIISGLAAPPPAGQSTWYVNQQVHFFTNISGGNPISSNGNNNTLKILNTDYHLFWSFGPLGPNGLPNAVEQDVAPNLSCPPTYNCSVAVQENFTYTDPGSYDVSLTAYDANLDFKVATILITVVEPTFGVFIAAPCNSNNLLVGQVCSTNYTYEEQSIEFNADATGIPPNGHSPNAGLFFQWDFGDGNVSYGPFVHHTYAINATYVVTVTVTNQTAQVSARAFILLAVREHPISPGCTGFAKGPGYVGIPVTFHSNISDPNPYDLANLTVQWDFGDGTQGSGLNATHIYATAGTYYPHILTIQGNHSQPIYVQCNVLVPFTVLGNSSAVSGRGVVVPVGQTAFLNESNYTSIVQLAALTNSSWTAASGNSPGFEGRTTSFTPRNESVSLSVTNPYAPTLTTSTTAQFTDVRPTVGVDSIYVNASAQVVVDTPSAYEWLDMTVVEDGVKNVTWHRLLWPATQYTFPYRQFALGHKWSLNLRYEGYGSSGSTYVDTYWSYTGTGNFVVDAYTEFFNSDPPNQDFVNISANWVSTGEPVWIHAVYFSPAQTSMATRWTMGDGTVLTGSTGAPSSGPTLDWSLVNYDWSSGAWYNMSIRATDASGLSGYANITVTNTFYLTANDTAPRVQAPTFTPKVTGDGIPNTFVANITSQTSVGNTGVRWQFGDGATSKQSYPNANTTANITHTYRYASQYLVVTYASSPNGSTSANFTFVNVLPSNPVASFTASSSSPYAYQQVTFSAVKSQDGPLGLGGLAFAWNFGDGALAGGYGSTGAVVSHTYTAGGTYTVTLTIQTAEGQVATQTQALTVNGTAPAVTFPSRSLSVDNFTLFHSSAALALADSPYIGVTWNWGNGTQTVAYDPGHTYLVPGNYTASVTISGGPYGTGVTATGYVNAVDDPQLMVFPYSGYQSTGENHSAYFQAYALGSYADSYYPKTFYTFNWQWGDGNVSTGLHSPFFNNQDTAYHGYNYTGAYMLNVSALSPFSPPYQTTGTASTTLTSSPDADGDGLPNAFENAVTHTSPYHVDNSTPSLTYYGTGFTDYISMGGLTGFGNFSADADNDGLTTMQEILGSVTGFPSNPFDANTAGDGILDGSHFISDTFRSDNVAPYGVGSANAAVVNISNVYYPGPAIAFHSASLFIQLNTTNSSSTSPVCYDPCIYVELQDPWGDPPFILLSPYSIQMTRNTETITLLNSTPATMAAPKTPYFGMTTGLFQKGGTWQVIVYTTSASAVGTIAEANLALSYYTDPGHADPTHQGLVQGHGITTPVLNCSEPSNAAYRLYNPKTFQFTNVNYFPYTEEYYKLSELQGVPYRLSSSASVDSANYAAYNATGSNCSASNVQTQLLGLTATYLGDADFGISPWNADVSGDSLNGTRITNGMKALGAATYDATADWYIQYNMYGCPGGLCTQASVPGNGYASDPLTYQQPLNPSVLSTQADGAADSFTESRTHPSGTSPLALGVTISSASATGLLTCQVVPKDAVQAEVVSEANQPSQLTPLVTGSGSGCGDTFSFNDYYTLPLDNSQPSFQVAFTLYHQLDSTPDQGTVTSPTLALANGVTWSSNGACNNHACFDVSVVVEPMQRAPTVLVNNSGELENLAGYGPRWIGEQQFYAFYLNINGTAPKYPHSPFATGSSPVLNTLLISRASYLETNFSTNLSGKDGLIQNYSHVFWCLNGAQMSVRGQGTSQLGVSGSLSASMNDTCANELLQQLVLYNATGNRTSAFLALNSSQVQLLGLAVQGGELAVFLPLPGFNSGPGAESIKSWQDYVGGVIVSAVNFVAHAIIAFVSNPIGSLVALGQTILGTIAAVCPACAAAINAALSALNFVLQVIEAAFRLVFNAIMAVVNPLINSAELAYALPYLSLMYQTGFINLTAYNVSIAVIDPSLPPPLTQPNAIDNFNAGAWVPVLAFATGAVVAVVAANWILNAATAGAETAVSDGTALALKQSGVIGTGVESAIKTGLMIVGSAFVTAAIGTFLSAYASSNPGQLQTLLQDIGFGTQAASAAVAVFGISKLLAPLQYSLELSKLGVVSFAAVYGLLIVALAMDISVAIIVGIEAALDAAHVNAPYVKAALIVGGLAMSTLAFIFLIDPDVSAALTLLGADPVPTATQVFSGVDLAANAHEAASLPSPL